MASVTVLRGGRVIDPESGTDRIADVALIGDKISGVGTDLPVPEGAEVVDAGGRIVGPGFVDLHSHAHSIAGQRLQAMDGVTTALDLEAGLMPIERAYAVAAAAGRPLNYGFSASWGAARAQVLMGLTPDADLQTGLSVLGDLRWQRDSSPAELTEWLALLEGELAQGALGIGVLMGYAPRTDPAEFLAVARLAAAASAPAYTHVRELVEADPTTPIDGSEELARAAAETGAAMHHCHVNSTSRRHVERVLAMLEQSRSAGHRVTLEAYPYGSGSTGIGAAFLAPDRLPVWGLQPHNIVLVQTGERIADLARLEQVRTETPGATCIVEFLDETDPADGHLLDLAMLASDSIVASDAMPVSFGPGVYDSRQWPLPPGGATHPRTAGTFAKSLRRMVRELGAWSWVEAFRRCSYLPARVLDDIAPAARGKGRLAVGADADIVVLDPDLISDAATYLDPTRPSIGIRELYVNGVPVISGGRLDESAYPGRGLRGQPR